MKKLLSGALALVLCAALSGCGSTSGDEKSLVIGASITPHAEIIKNIQPDLEEMGYTVEIVEFSNYFQHNQYLAEWNEKSGTDLVSAGDIHFEPMGIYSQNHDSLDELEEGAKLTISIPNDPTNGGRALQLLAANGLIKLEGDKGISATPKDIVDGPYEVEIVEMAAESIPVNLGDVDFGVANGNNALNAQVLDRLIVAEDAGGVAQQFANCVAVRNGDQDTQKIKDLMSVLRSQKTIDFINENYDGIVVPFFEAE